MKKHLLLTLSVWFAFNLFGQERQVGSINADNIRSFEVSNVQALRTSPLPHISSTLFVNVENGKEIKDATIVMRLRIVAVSTQENNYRFPFSTILQNQILLIKLNDDSIIRLVSVRDATATSNHVPAVRTETGRTVSGTSNEINIYYGICHKDLKKISSTGMKKIRIFTGIATGNTFFDFDLTNNSPQPFFTRIEEILATPFDIKRDF